MPPTAHMSSKTSHPKLLLCICTGRKKCNRYINVMKHNMHDTSRCEVLIEAETNAGLRKKLIKIGYS